MRRPSPRGKPGRTKGAQHRSNSLQRQGHDHRGPRGEMYLFPWQLGNVHPMPRDRRIRGRMNFCRQRRFDRGWRGCYDALAGWSSLVARWAHNPKVGGSNPPPATNLFIGLQVKLLFPAGAKRGIIGCFGGLSFCLFECRPKYHLYYLAVGCSLRFHHGVAIDVHGGRNLSVPHQFLLHSHRSANRVEPGAIGVAECVPPDVAQPELSSSRTDIVLSGSPSESSWVTCKLARASACKFCVCIAMVLIRKIGRP